MRHVVLVLLVACGDGTPPLTETGNPDLEATLRVLARTSEPAAISIEGAAPVDVTEATAAVDRARLVMGVVCDVPGEVEWDVPMPATTDLVADTAAIPFDAESGDYCRMRVRLNASSGDDVLFVAGTRDDGARFEIRSSERVDVDVRSRTDPFPLEEGTEKLLLAFDVARWLADVPLDDAATDGDGVARIDGDSNTDLLEVFDAAVESSLALFSDEDGDDTLDDGEPELATSDP